jgi:hypothetical protein
VTLPSKEKRKVYLRRQRSWLIFLVFGAFSLVIAYDILTNKSFPVQWPGHSFSIKPSGAPLLSDALAAVLVVLGIVLVIAGLRRLAAGKSDIDADVNLDRNRSSRTRHIWLLFNLSLVAFSVWAGYEVMNAESLRQINPDGIFCVVILLVMPAFVIGTLAFAATERFVKPSWFRSPVNWSHDPLQANFISTWCLLGVALGSSFRLRGSGNVGFWAVASFWSATLGLLIGQLIALVIYRDRIVDNNAHSAVK